MVRENKVGLSAEHVTMQEQTLTDEQEQADGLTVTGLALPFGETSRNGVVYEEESVREAAETMIGTPVLFNHDQDEVVGHVEDVEVHGDGMSYRMNLNPDHELVDSVERGDISNVSIQALVDPVDGDTKKVEVKEFLELSLVTIPGFKQTDVEVEEVGKVPDGVMTVESFMEKAESGDEEESEDGIENASKSEENNILGDLSMEKIEEQLSADEVDSVMELINLHNEAMKEDIRQYMEENDLIEDDEDDSEEPVEEPEDDMDDEEEEESVDETEESQSESVDEEESEDGSEDSETESEEDVEDGESEDDTHDESEEETDDEEEAEESVDDEPVDPVAEEMSESKEEADFSASIPRISR